MIAAHGANDEVSLHRAPALAAAGRPRSTIMSPRTTQSFHLPQAPALTGPRDPRSHDLHSTHRTASKQHLDLIERSPLGDELHETRPCA
jgi:hypothetical protein